MTTSQKPPEALLAIKTSLPADLYAKSLITIYSNLEHICIDKDPVAELLLRLELSKINVSPESVAEKIFGYLAMDLFGKIYFFVNESQHLELQKVLNQSAPCKT